MYFKFFMKVFTFMPKRRQQFQKKIL